MKKICLLSSSGGHYEQLLMLIPALKDYNFYIITERTEFLVDLKWKYHFLKQLNRKEILFFPKLIFNFIKSVAIYFREKPNIVICTGALSTIPFCLLSKLFKTKFIYIESFAKVKTGSLTGRFLYYFADVFYVQWEELLETYPRAIFKGRIY